ncbi:hypothetical protein NP233_g2492 [Leucocoprinus birnbaumii]|uniref:Uncharacterized protein n=1 Tax=Leucocoprinus birnbaumii TaxID=56174 RepID=A0AAD5YUV1_9AGAR|nr:hypothetical protein NP233_g2492 [Leucocoprinus birnbaumii]
MLDPLRQDTEPLPVIEETSDSHVATTENSDSDEDWENERKTLAHGKREVSQLPISEDSKENEDGDEEEFGEFVYPGTSAVTQVEPMSSSTISEVALGETPLTGRVESNQVPESEHEQARAPSPPHETLHPPIIVATPPTCYSPSSTLAPEAMTFSLSAPLPPPSLPSPAQLESLCAAASSGDLPLLKRLFVHAVESNAVQQFSLANDASTRTGFTALHAASSRGHLDIVQWLIEDCGAMPDLEDREGETALHKAALNGHMSVVRYLVPHKADVHARDADGWTALHNASSKGYLDIVKYLCEKGGATAPVEGVPGVDIRSKDGWTPLMNAASKGHLPIVLYLLSKQGANPLIRNKWGETAYDAAAAVFEVWICEVLQQSEAERWRGTTTPYNPLLVHTTLPLILYEYQRLDLRLKTVATSGGRPRFSASGLGKRGRRAPYELKLPRPDEDTGVRLVAASRGGVQLPLRDAPWDIPRPVNVDRPAPDITERSHFWLSDWTLDVTHPGVDAEEGWQYAQSFDDPDERWTGERSSQLERILTGSGVVAAGFGGSSSRNASLSSPIPGRIAPTWVRRRRWVRIMRRRLDIPPLPYLEPDGVMYHLDSDGTLIPYVEEQQQEGGESEGQELGAMSSTFFSSAQDYVGRARYLVGNSHHDDEETNSISAIDVRRVIAKLERATEELRTGILSEYIHTHADLVFDKKTQGDEDVDRRRQAEVLLNTYSRELERRRLAAGAQGLILTGLDDDQYEEDDVSSEEEFRYPSATPEGTRPTSRASHQTDYSSRPGVSRAPTDLTPQLSQAPEFRVPTREAPQKVITPHWTPPTPHQLTAQWERDDQVNHCRDCHRKFTFLLRRHVSLNYQCGRIFCDRCSTFRVLLDPADIIHDPTGPEPTGSSSSQRVCHTCYEEVIAGVPNRLTNRGHAIERIVVDQERLSVPGSLTRRESSSQLSDLADCPVCNQNLDDVGDAVEQEEHVRQCLEGGSGQGPSAARYLVYRLPAESTLLGVECVICLEEFVKGSTVARLSCFCSFHNACLSSWLQRGKSCPVHAR